MGENLRLKNTYTGELEEFEALDVESREVKLYSCGPTVYSYAHIGNFRSFLMADILRRTLELNGYTVRHVMNITDVGHMTVDDLADARGEDKLHKAAREHGWSPYKVAAFFEAAFREDAISLRLKNYSEAEVDNDELHPRATSYIAEMLQMIQALLDKGYAYIDEQGQVYYDLERFPEYGKLSGKKLEDLEIGARVAVGKHKKNPRDFYLWKVDEKHLMRWDPHSPEGWLEEDYQRFQSLCPQGVDARIQAGFPGWHIECSAMSTALLGLGIDIHTGGEDNIFPHHECEIAQSYGAHEHCLPAPASASDAGAQRKSFSRYWVHGRHLLVNNRKMSKRDGTFYTVRDLLGEEQGEDKSKSEKLKSELQKYGFTDGSVAARFLRYALISSHYTQPLNFNFELLEQAKKSVERFQQCYDSLLEEQARQKTKAQEESSLKASEKIQGFAAQAQSRFLSALNDNLNMPRALAVVFESITEINKFQSLELADCNALLELLKVFDSVLDVLDHQRRSGLLTRKELGDLEKEVAESRAKDYEKFAGMTQSQATEGEFFKRLIAARELARKEKDYQGADSIRELLEQAGVTIQDTAEGVRWSLR